MTGIWRSKHSAGFSRSCLLQMQTTESGLDQRYWVQKRSIWCGRSTRSIHVGMAKPVCRNTGSGDIAMPMSTTTIQAFAEESEAKRDLGKTVDKRP